MTATESTAESHGSRVIVLGTEAVERVLAAQFSSSPIPITRQTITDARADDIVLVAAEVGDERFSVANEFTQTNASLLVTIEFGGIGGHAIDAVDAGISLLPPDGPCHSCLAKRVVSAASDQHTDANHPPGIVEYASALAGAQLLRDTSASPQSWGQCIELPHQERTILPVPDCPVCQPSQPDRSLPRQAWSAEPRSLDATQREGERAVDSRLGPITSIGEFTSIPVPYYLATVASTDGFSDATASHQAAGVSPDWNLALMKALGEGLERYAAGIYQESDFRHASPGEIESAIDPDDVVRPDDRDPITDDIPWVSGIGLLDGRSYWLPAELVHFPPPESRIRPAITTGLGLGNSMAEATIAGLTEIIERDAMMLAWYSTGKPLGVRIDDADFDRLTRQAAIESLEVSTVLLTQDVDIPVLAATVYRDDPWPRVALGTAAALDATDAARSALEEAIQNWVELDNMGEDRAASEASRIADHAADPSALDRYISPTANVSAASISHRVPDSPADVLSKLETLVADAGLSPIVARITTCDLELLGFEAVRVVEPRTQPLFTGDPYFGERARVVPASFGESPRLDSEPHPFP